MLEMHVEAGTLSSNKRKAGSFTHERPAAGGQEMLFENTMYFL